MLNRLLLSAKCAQQKSSLFVKPLYTVFTSRLLLNFVFETFLSTVRQLAKAQGVSFASCCYFVELSLRIQSRIHNGSG